MYLYSIFFSAISEATEQIVKLRVPYSVSEVDVVYIAGLPRGFSWTAAVTSNSEITSNTGIS